MQKVVVNSKIVTHGQQMSIFDSLDAGSSQMNKQN